MPPADHSSWQDVETLEDFHGYLLAQSEEAASDSCSWRNIAVPMVLGGWISFLATSERSFDEPPGWTGLAEFLHVARDHEFTFVCHRPTDLVDSAEGVSDVGSLMLYLIWLCTDFAADQRELDDRRLKGLWALEGRWAHSDLAGWLETWAA